MESRVTILEGKQPIIIVAPYGYDDDYTADMAQAAAKSINAYAVLNWGWQRAPLVDWSQDKANCNDIRHLHEDVVREEFFEPLQRYCIRIKRKFEHAYVFLLHGMGYVDNIQVVVGYGAGDPPHHSCPIWRKNLFCHLVEDIGLKVRQGKAGGKYSGWAKSNLNQLWRRHEEYFDPYIQSMQLEVNKSLRSSKNNAELHGEYLGAIMEECCKQKSWYPDKEYRIQEY